jgi:DNA-damage-inducible protein D
VEENNESLKRTAIKMGVLPQNWGRFEEAGYKGLYGGLDKAEIKTKKGIAQEEDILDRMGKLELAINDFRITQTEDKLLTEKIIGQSAAVQTHENIGLKVRKAIEDIGGKYPLNKSR